MSITKKIRFEVFKRDGFKCAYCGKSPPDVILEVDHIEPKSKGGSDEPTNLLASCFDCNRGKRDIPLEKIPPHLSENIEVLREKETQIKEYRRFIEKINNRIQSDIDQIQDVFRKTHKRHYFSDKARRSIGSFIKQLPIDVLLDAMAMATERIENPESCLRYFYGICWNKIRGK